MSIYKRKGYENRKHYLESIAADFGIDVDVVFNIAALLGSNEDFDGLLTTLSDYTDQSDYIDQ